ncbi:acetyltransferase [Desnuesiella massiliensis]|uniref:acetyltransferase n=1 Tax=Desnuesiella massiliensis TaxID=1650662 RepID=UPI0006E22B0C|nr:acetyltransferase [Desnuesiella massiliensis]
MSKKIVLLGAGGHCKVIIDIIKSTSQYEIIGITDKNVRRSTLDIPILGDDNILENLYKNGIEYAFICLGAIDNLSLRNNLYKMLKNIGFKIPVLIHKNAIISQNVSIGEGTCIMPGAIVNSGAYIGENCIINTGSVIEHDCKIQNNTHISPKVCLGGGVKIGYNSHIGIGANIIQGISIGNDVTIGVGAVVINNLEDNCTAVGVPAKPIKFK